MSFQTLIIASGSKGNCLVVQTENTALLLDAGVSMRRIQDSMTAQGMAFDKLSAVIVSHEHSDHTRSVGAISRKLRIPIFINRSTLGSCEWKLGRVDDRIEFFNTGTAFQIGDIIVEAFASSHDAADSCNFVFYPEFEPTRRLGVATDLGYPTQLSVVKLSNATTLVLESNHDEVMLMEGPYDWHLKQRIRSSQGHLSNLQAVGLVSSLMHPGLKTLILAHLSEVNNHPELARSTMSSYLQSIRSEVRLIVAEQDRATELIDV